MTGSVRQENPHAGQGAVLLDIGGDVGALIVTMPAAMDGTEVEIRPLSRPCRGNDVAPERHIRAHGHGPGDHVAVVNRPVGNSYVASLVFPELVEGSYELFEKGTDDVRLTVHVHGGEVAAADWPQ
jgi:hypothetical protein